MDQRELDDLTLARAQRGEPEALRALVERYQGTVFAYLGRMLLVDRDHATVKDLAQDTLVRVLQRLSEFDPRGAARLSTWILTIATNLALDELRARPSASASSSRQTSCVWYPTPRTRSVCPTLRCRRSSPSRPTPTA